MSSLRTKTESAKECVEQLLKWLQLLFNTGAVISLLAVAAVVSLQIFARYALPKAPVWTEEASRYFFIYSIVLASSAVLVSGRHVKLELFQDSFSERAKLIYTSVCHIIIAVFCIMLIQHSWDYTINGNRQTSPALGVKMVWVFGSTLVFFSLVTVTCLLLTARDILSFIIKGRESRIWKR